MNLLEPLGSTIKGFAKILIQSRHTTLKRSARQRPLIIMGNGPSLNRTISEEMPALEKSDLMAVNFAAISPVFTQLKPEYYILADPYFFRVNGDERLAKLYNTLLHVDWPMTLLVPQNMAKQCRMALQRYAEEGNESTQPTAPANIHIETFNAVGVEGYQWFQNAAYRHGLAMPRPRNVLITAIMCGLALGYDDIYIVGADHSWMQSIYVDSNNHVVSVQPHFYEDDERERQRVYSEYAGYRLHDIIKSFYVAFHSYHQIAAYAARRGVHIYNSTPDSYIDAFPRRPLP